jgi:hypothetical protein
LVPVSFGLIQCLIYDILLLLRQLRLLLMMLLLTKRLPK